MVMRRGNHDRSGVSDHDRSRLRDHDRGGGYDIALLRREENVIQIAEKSVYSTGIFPVIDMPSGDVGIVTGTSGKKTSRQR